MLLSKDPQLVEGHPADHIPLPLSLTSQALEMAPSLVQAQSDIDGSRGVPFVYIPRLHSGALYTGCSTDFESRFRDHQAGTACRTTKLAPPRSLVWIELHPDFPSARRRDSQIKKWSRAKKEALIQMDPAKLRELAKSRSLRIYSTPPALHPNSPHSLPTTELVNRHNRRGVPYAWGVEKIPARLFPVVRSSVCVLPYYHDDNFFQSQSR